MEGSLKNLARTALALVVAGAGSLAAAGGASAAWEKAQVVDNQGPAAGATGKYVGLADGGNGTATAFFEQTVNGAAGYYAIRRGATDAAWAAPQTTPFANGPTPLTPDLPIEAAADSNGNALGLTAQQEQIWATAWPSGAAIPGSYSMLFSDPMQNDLSDAQVAFDGYGHGYAVSGQPPNGPTQDQVIYLSTYTPSGGWTTPAPIVATGQASATTCPDAAGATPAGIVCGEEPRLAVSTDGAVVIAFLQGCSNSNLPNTTNCQLFAVRAPAGAVIGSAGAQGFNEWAHINKSGDRVPVTSSPLGSSSSTTPANYDVAIDSSDTAWIVDTESQTGLNNNVYATEWPANKFPPDPPAQISSGSPPEPPASTPRVVASGTDVTVAWIEASESSPPPADALFSAECCFTSSSSTSPSWTTPESVTGSIDSPSNSSGYSVNTPPFWLAEDAGANAYLVWTNGGSWQASNRVPPLSGKPQAWSPPVTIAGVSGAVPGTARVAAGASGQADAVVIGASGSRSSALFASRLTVAAATQTTGNQTPSQPLGNPANGSPPPSASTAKPKPCTARPTSRINRGKAHASRKGITASGSARERVCTGVSAATRSRNRVVKVFVAIYRPAGRGRCRFLLRNGHLTKPLPCSRPIEYRARGTSRWTFTLRAKIPSGFYLVRSDAVDGFHRHQVHLAVSVVGIRVRKRHR